MHAELILEVPVEHGLLLENLLDLAHAPFTHTSTFAKGWPIPDVVKFNAQKLLGGNWEPYPIDMAFEPPCMVLSTIGVLSAMTFKSLRCIVVPSFPLACFKSHRFVLNAARALHRSCWGAYGSPILLHGL